MHAECWVLPTKIPHFSCNTATAARKSLRFSGKTQNLAINMSVLLYETINCFTERNQKAKSFFITYYLYLLVIQLSVGIRYSRLK